MNYLALNIRRLRTSQGMTQSELATRAGLSRPTISHLEDASSEASSSSRTLQAVSNALGVTLSELFQEVKYPSFVRFRALTQFKSREQVLADALNAYERYRQLERKVDEELPIPEDFEKACQYAQSLASEMGVVRAQKVAKHVRETVLKLDMMHPLPPITSVIERMGVRVISMPYHTDAFGLCFISHEAKPVIVINISDRITTERWIFSASHELGHLLMHMSQGSQFSEEIESVEEENEANSFAAELLMPQAAFELLWGYYYKSLPFVDAVLEIKRRFAVSYQTVLMRKAKGNREVYQKELARFKEEYDTRYNTDLSITTEASGSVDMGRYDSWIVPVSFTSQEPENLGAGMPRSPMFFPQGRTMRLLVQAIESSRIEADEVAQMLYTTREVATAFMGRVKDAIHEN